MNEWYKNEPNDPAPAPVTPPPPRYYVPQAPAAPVTPPPAEPPKPAYSPIPENPAPKKEKKDRKGAKIIALALVCAILGGLLGTGVTLTVLRTLGRGDRSDGATILLEGQRARVQLAEVPAGELMSASQVYAQNVNSTVGITTAITTNFFGYQTTTAASGSGFILSEDGYILTNYHVIDSSSAITVTLYNGESYDAELVGYDESNDIAVLKLDAEGLTPVVLGHSDDLLVGDSVVAIGNPLGELTFSLTVGVVSALDREVTLDGGVSMDLIQTDCAINSGNSGGALFNLYGEVIGITNAKYSSSSLGEASIDNIGFAIPIDTVKAIVESIIEYGYIVKPYIGVSVSDVTADSQALGLPEGAAVKSVTEGAPADKAGLAVNDIITEANGLAIHGSSDLVDLVGTMEPGDKLKLTVYRQGETLTLNLTVEENRQEALPEETQSSDQSSQQPSQQMPDSYEGYGYMPFSFEDFFRGMF